MATLSGTNRYGEAGWEQLTYWAVAHTTPPLPYCLCLGGPGEGGAVRYRLAPVIWPLCSAVSILRMYGMMLSARNIANEASKKQLFRYAGTHQPECRQAGENAGQPVEGSLEGQGVWPPGFTRTGPITALGTKPRPPVPARAFTISVVALVGIYRECNDDVQMCSLRLFITTLPNPPKEKPGNLLTEGRVKLTCLITTHIKEENQSL